MPILNAVEDVTQQALAPGDRQDGQDGRVDRRRGVACVRSGSDYMQRAIDWISTRGVSRRSSASRLLDASDLLASPVEHGPQDPNAQGAQAMVGAPDGR
jgi:hypothetical protein